MKAQRTRKSRVLTHTVFVQTYEIQRQNIFAGRTWSSQGFLKTFQKCNTLFSTKYNIELEMKFWLCLQENYIYTGVFQI